MHDSDTSLTPAEQQTDQQLKQSFTPMPELSGSFDDMVMKKIGQKQQSLKYQRIVLLIMSAYWVAAILLGSWLVLGGETSTQAAAESGRASSVLAVLALVAAGIYLLLRQSRLRLSELFIGTIR